MFIENWKDTAFGSDFGMYVLDFLESFPGQYFTLDDLYSRSNLQMYFAEPELLLQHTDNNLNFSLPNGPEVLITVHYEDMLIALCAVAVECLITGKADLTTAYGTKSVVLKITSEELQSLTRALAEIYQNPERFVLFEMCGSDERQETLDDVKSILEQLKSLH